MSHLISGVEVEGQLLFSSCQNRTNKHKIRQFLRSNTLEKLFDRKGTERVIEKICVRYSEQEQQKLNLEKQLFTRHQTSQVRKRLRFDMNKNNQGRSVQNILQNQVSLPEQTQQSLTLYKMSEGMPGRLSIEKKHKCPLSLKIGNLIETKQISNQKQVYRNWVNQQNIRNNNPNLKKMSFIFEKLIKKRKLKHSRTQPSQQRTPSSGVSTLTTDLMASFQSSFHHRKRKTEEPPFFIVQARTTKNNFKKLKRHKIPKNNDRLSPPPNSYHYSFRP